MFGFGKSSSKRAKDTIPSQINNSINLSLYDDGRDKYWGLENFGSTCYANSVLQALYYTPIFRNALINAPVAKDSDNASSIPQTTLDRILSEPYAQHSYVYNTTTQPAITKKKKGLTSWSTDEEEKEEYRKRAFYPKGEIPPPHPMFPDPPANKNDPAFRGQEMKPTDDTATDLFKKKLLEEHTIISPQARIDKEALLFNSLKDVYSHLVQQKQRTGILSPKSFMDSLRIENEMFRQNMHHDAHEFLNYILNSVHDGYTALNSMDSLHACTFVHQIFQGTLASEVRCLTCENVTSRDESFLDLSLDIEENTSVSACMRAFSASEFLREKNKFFCEKCNGLQEAERRMKIRKLPNVLALHLKRFKFEQDAQRHVKLQHVVRYETTLRLGNTTDDAIDPDRLYELYAIVVHLGGASYHGHYIACVRTDHLGWVLYDDEHVERIPESVVMRFVGGEDSGTACAYVLFYRTVDVEEPLESRASLKLSQTSIHAVQMPSEVAAQSSAVTSPFLTSPLSPKLGFAKVSLASGLLPSISSNGTLPDRAAEENNQTRNGISPPQAAHMKRSLSSRLSTTPSTHSATSKPSARRMLSSVFSSNGQQSSSTPTAITETSPNESSPLSPTTSASSAPTSSVTNSTVKPSAISSLPSFNEKMEYHDPYTSTTVIATPLEEMDEPDWANPTVTKTISADRPQRPILEKKNSSLSRFSSFRGKKSLFGLKDKKENHIAETVEIEKPVLYNSEKTKRRTSVFGMGSK